MSVIYKGILPLETHFRFPQLVLFWFVFPHGWVVVLRPKTVLQIRLHKGNCLAQCNRLFSFEVVRNRSPGLSDPERCLDSIKFGIIAGIPREFQGHGSDPG